MDCNGREDPGIDLSSVTLDTPRYLVDGECRNRRQSRSSLCYKRQHCTQRRIPVAVFSLEEDGGEHLQSYHIPRDSDGKEKVMPPPADASTANFSYKALTRNSRPSQAVLRGPVCRSLYPEFTNADKKKHTPLATPRERVKQCRLLRSLAPIATWQHSMPIILTRR